MTKNHPSLLKEKRLTKKKLREIEARVSHALNLNLNY